jgi:hypothetical protein
MIQFIPFIAALIQLIASSVDSLHNIGIIPDENTISEENNETGSLDFSRYAIEYVCGDARLFSTNQIGKIFL